MIAGPAPGRTPASPAIAVPVVAKIPAPMMAPTPSAVRCHFPRARLSPLPSPVSAVSSATDLRARSWDIGTPKKGGEAVIRALLKRDGNRHFALNVRSIELASGLEGVLAHQSDE